MTVLLAQAAQSLLCCVFVALVTGVIMQAIFRAADWMEGRRK